MADREEAIAFLREMRAWKQNTGSVPEGADADALGLAFLRKRGGEFGELAARRLAEQREQISRQVNPRALQDDINPAAGAAASAWTGLESSLATGGDLSIGLRRLLEGAADKTVEHAGPVLSVMDRLAGKFVDKFPGVAGALSRADDALPASLKMGSEEAAAELDEGRALADEYAQGHMGTGRVPRMAGGLGGLGVNLALLSKVPGLRGPGVASGMSRFAAESLLRPEIQAVARDRMPEGPHLLPYGDEEDSTRGERAIGRVAEGALLDLLLRGAGAAGSGAVRKATPGAVQRALPVLSERVAQGAGQAAALGGLGAVMAPEGEGLEEAGAGAIVGAALGAMGKKFPPRGRGSKAEPAPPGEPQPTQGRPYTRAEAEARRAELRPEGDTPASRSGPPARRAMEAGGDPLWRAMVRGDRPSYLLPGDGNPALRTPSERKFIAPPAEMLKRRGIVPVRVPGLGLLYVNKKHPLYAGAENVPEFIRSMRQQGREHELLGYTDAAEMKGATHIVTGVDEAGKEVVSVRTKDPLQEATALENVDGIAETVVRPNSPEAVLKVNTERIRDAVESAPKDQPAPIAATSPHIAATSPLHRDPPAPAKRATPRERADTADPSTLTDSQLAAAKRTIDRRHGLVKRDADKWTPMKDERLRRPFEDTVIAKDLAFLTKRKAALDAEAARRAAPQETAPKPKAPRKKRDIRTDESGAIDYKEFAESAKRGAAKVGSATRNAVLDVREFERSADSARGKLADFLGEQAQKRLGAGFRRMFTEQSPIRAVRELREKYQGHEKEWQDLSHSIADLASRMKDAIPESEWQRIHIEHFDRGTTLPKDSPLRGFQDEFRKLVEESAALQVEAGNLDPQTVAKYQKYGTQGYATRVPGGKEAARRATEAISKVLSQVFGKGDPTNIGQRGSEFVRGAGSMARGVRSEMDSARKARKQLSPDAAFSDRVYTKNGQMLAGKVVQKHRHGVRIKTNDGNLHWIKRPDIDRVEYAYQSGLYPIVRSIEKQGRIRSALKTFKDAKADPAFKKFWRESEGAEAPKGFVRIPKDAREWGVFAGTDMHKSVYHDLRFWAKPDPHAVLQLADRIVSTIKVAKIIDPDYPQKVFLWEAPLNAAGAGLTPGGMVKYMPQAWRALEDYLAGKGEPHPAIKALRDAGELFAHGHQQELTEGRPDVGQGYHRTVKGRGIEYIKGALQQARAEYGRRLEMASRKLERQGEEPGIWHVLTEGFGSFIDLAWQFDLARAAGAKEGHRFLRASGEALKDSIQYEDALFKVATVMQLTERGKEGFVRRAARAGAGLPKDNPYTMDEAIHEVELNWNPKKSLGPFINRIGQYTFLRFPAMLATNLGPRARAVSSPHAAAFALFIAPILQSGMDWTAQQMGIDWWDDDEIEKEKLRQSYGDKARARELVAIPIGKDEAPLMLDFGSVSIRGAPASLDLKRQPNEGWAMEKFRELSSLFVPLQAGWGLVGKDPRYLDKKPDTGAVGLERVAEIGSNIGLPGAEYARTGLRGHRKEGEQQEKYGESEKDALSRLAGFFTGLPANRGARSGGGLAGDRDSFLRHIENKQDAIDAGARFHYRQNMPEPIMDGDSEETIQRKLTQWRAWEMEQDER